MSDAVYARNATRPRPRARRALVELETLNSARLPVVSCFRVPARPSLVVSVVRCVWVWGWGLIARYARVWSFLYQSLRPLGACAVLFNVIGLSRFGLNSSLPRAIGSYQDNVSYGWGLSSNSRRVVFSLGVSRTGPSQFSSNLVMFNG